MKLRKITAALLSTLMIAVCFSGCTSGNKKASGEESQVFDTKSEKVEKSKEIVIDNSTVNTELVFKKRDGNDIEAYLHGKISIEKDAKQPSVNISKDGDKVVVKIEKDSKIDEAIKDSSLILEIYVPDNYKGKVDVKSTSGKVVMNASKALECTLNAKTASGEIKNTLGIENKAQDTKKEIKGKLKSGVTNINIETSEGGIEINKAE